MFAGFDFGSCSILSDFDVSFVITINTNNVFAIFAVILNQYRSISIKIVEILAISANHSAVISIGIEVIFAVSSEQCILAIPRENMIIALASIVFMLFPMSRHQVVFFAASSEDFP